MASYQSEYSNLNWWTFIIHDWNKSINCRVSDFFINIWKWLRHEITYVLAQYLVLKFNFLKNNSKYTQMETYPLDNSTISKSTFLFSGLLYHKQLKWENLWKSFLNKVLGNILCQIDRETPSKNASKFIRELWRNGGLSKVQILSYVESVTSLGNFFFPFFSCKY